MSAAGIRPAVFLDRDGTLIEEVDGGFLRRVEDLTLYPWTPSAVRQLNEAGFVVVVATNQSGVARGYFDEVFLESVHRTLNERLASEGARIDAFYYCPHHPEAVRTEYRVHCACRKPLPGMIQTAAADMGLDLSRSWMVGDTWRDVRCGDRAGMRTVLVTTGQGADAAAAGSGDVEPDAILTNLMEAVAWILRKSSSR